MRIFLKETAVILFLTAVSAILFNSFSAHGLTLIYQPLRFEAGSHVNLAELKKILGQKQAVLIDARSAEEFKQGHIDGALSLPLASVRDKKMEFVQRYKKTQLFIFYCSNASCNQAQRLAGEFRQMGYSNRLIFEEGYDGWREAQNLNN